MGYDQLMRPQRAGQGGEYATLNPNAVSPAFLKSLLNCALENDLWETEPGTVQMNEFPIASLPTIGTVFQFFPESGVSRIVACGRDGTVWISTDDGKSFTLASSALQPNRLVVPVTGGKELTGNPKKLFLFGGGAPLILTGDATADAGLPSPTVGISLTIVAQTGAVNPGDHEYVYTFGNAIGETAPSPRGLVTVNNPNNAKVTVGVPAGIDGTLYRKIYRTKAAGDITTLFLLTTLNDNTTLTYLDNTPDGSLETKVPPVANATSSIHNLSRPPADWTAGNQPIGGFILEGRMAGFGNQNQQHGLYYSTREDHEDFLSPGSGFLPVFTGKGDGIKAGVYWRSQGWLLKSPRGIYRVDTSNIDPVQWQVHEHSESVGCPGPMALTLVKGADESQFFDDVVFIAPDGSWHRMSKTGAYQAGDVNASSISESTYGEFIRTNVDKARLPFCQLIYFDEIEEIWGAFTQLYGTINKLRIKASLKRLPEFGIRFHHSNFPECEGLGLMINVDNSRTPIAGGSLGVVKRCYQKVFTDAAAQYQSVWETWDDNFQDLGENYKVSLKNYHFLVVEGLSVGDWTMFVEVYIDGVLQPTLLSISMKGKGSQFILDQSQLDQQALGTTKPLFVVSRLHGRGHRIRYRGYLGTDSAALVTDSLGFGQTWRKEASDRGNVVYPAASVFINDMTVYAFHRSSNPLVGGLAWFKAASDAIIGAPQVAVFLSDLTVVRFYVSGTSLRYKRSVDGGLTFPGDHATSAPAVPATAVLQTARAITDPVTGTPVVFVMNQSSGGSTPNGLYISHDVHDHLEDSAWTQTDLSATHKIWCFDVDATGQQVCVMGFTLVGSNVDLLTSNDGGLTFPNVFATAESLLTPGSMQLVVSVALNQWVVFNSSTGTVRRSTDNGASWTLVTTLTPGTGTADTGAIISLGDNRLVIAFRSQIYTSDDGGATWTARQDLSASNGDITYFGNFGSGVVGAVSHSLLTAGTAAGLLMWRSTDYGVTWAAVAEDGGSAISNNVARITTFAVSSTGRFAIIIGGQIGVGPTDWRYWYTNPGKLDYDVSSDGGQTFPLVRETEVSSEPYNIIGARTIVLSDGTLRVLLLQTLKGILYSDTIVSLPMASTWTQVALSATSLIRIVGFEASGLNVLVAGDDLADFVVWRSSDGGATFSSPVVVVPESTTAAFGYQIFCSPTADVWCLLNPNSGSIFRSTDNGATWGASVKTITPGNASLPKVGAIFAVSATRVVAIYKGQVSVSDDAGVTWTDKQNLTVIGLSPVDVKQGGIGYFANFGLRNGVTVLGGVTNYADAFDVNTTRGAMWRSVDLGDTWTLIDAVGGGLVTTNASTAITAFPARNGRGVLDLWNIGTGHRDTWFNPSVLSTIGQYFKIQQIQTGFSLGGFSGGNK